MIRNQKERIFGAMVALAATKGYPATTVADLLVLAGVSRATFYEHFEDKADCFRTMVQTLLNAGLELIEQNLSSAEPANERGKRAMMALLELAADQPAASRVSLVESYSAGEAGLHPINRAFENACELAHRALNELPDREETPPELARAIIGGLHRVLYRCLHRGEADELRENRELWEWVVGYPPPKDLPKPRRKRVVPNREPHPGRDRYEQILRSFASAASRFGYSRLTVPQIVSEAGISNGTFYRYFDGKEDALFAALDLSGAQLVAATVPAARRISDWPQAVGRALENACGFLVAEPDFARLRTVEVYSAGPEAIEHRDRAWAQIAREIVPEDVRARSRPGPLAKEASRGAVYALLYEKVRRGQLDRLSELPPLLTYIVLTPYLGASDAQAVAAGHRFAPMSRR